MFEKWEIDDIKIVETEFDYDLHEFEIYWRDMLVGTINPGDLEVQEEIKKAFEDGNNPLKDGWEDGKGNTLRYPNWVIEKGHIREDETTAIDEETPYFDKAEALKNLRALMVYDDEYAGLVSYDNNGEYDGFEETYYGMEAKKIMAKVNPNNYNVFGLILKETRTKKELTQQELANKLGVNYQHYQKWEYGERTPNGLNILKLIEILDLDKDEIMEALEK